MKAYGAKAEQSTRIMSMCWYMLLEMTLLPTTSAQTTDDSQPRISCKKRKKIVFFSFLSISSSFESQFSGFKVEQITVKSGNYKCSEILKSW